MIFKFESTVECFTLQLEPLNKIAVTPEEFQVVINHAHSDTALSLDFTGR